MNPYEELAELIEQTKEHLRYYQELGITHLEEALHTSAVADTSLATTAQSAAPSPAPAPAPAQTEVARPLVKEPALTALPVTPTAPPLPATILPAMAKKAAAPETSSLFNPVDAPPPPQAYTSLEEIRANLGECQRCKLWRTRTNLVFGEGNPQADLMFVGEAPGADEDATGRPFVGRAGQLLTKMIEAIDLKREQVYIANVLKSRPPNNRNPEKDEIDACKPFLLGQIAVIKPKLIVTLGNPATQLLLETKVGITRLRGEFQEYPHLKSIKVIPTFHPAYLLRSPDKKREAWEDLKKVRAFLRGELNA